VVSGPLPNGVIEHSPIGGQRATRSEMQAGSEHAGADPAAGLARRALRRRLAEPTRSERRRRSERLRWLEWRRLPTG